MIENIHFEKMNGLVPAIVQDSADGTVLMVGFMNREALEQTLAQNRVVFWSRSKSRLWKKGETSGNFLNVVAVDVDCDGDSLLILARPEGPVCHTGERSCFPAKTRFTSRFALQDLEATITERKKSMPENSYTAKLFKDGVARIAQKVGEEAVELAIAAQHSDRKRVVEESADVMYHVLVLLAEKEIALTDVLAELDKRRK